MDPNANLQDQLGAAAAIMNIIDGAYELTPIEANAVIAAAESLATRVLELNEWIVSGEALPVTWGRLSVRINTDAVNPPGKLADAELHFHGGHLDGTKLIGFAVWQMRQGTGLNVTFPARTYSVNGERRAYALLRPVTDDASRQRVADLIKRAYDAHVAESV